jgi:hypothetical protein
MAYKGMIYEFPTRVRFLPGPISGLALSEGYFAATHSGND